MGWGELPRAPIIGLTSLLEPEIRTAALAFGCDAVLEKDPPLSLAARITAALQEARSTAGLDGLDAMLQLARPEESRRMKGRALAKPPAQPRLTDADITAAMLAYRRYGVIGLGESVLALALVPQAVSVLRRGEAAYMQLMGGLSELAYLGAGEAATILRMELECEATPRQRALERALSRAQYYRHRQRAVGQLRDLLAHDE
jgi:hypothetical protein